ncbi:MAG: hypothetical protein IJZ86_06205 [Bacteroides sp.]|nr:hypothetical protein [Bacteroides sp.]
MRILSFLLLFLCGAAEAYSQLQNTPFSGNHQTKVPAAESCIITIIHEYDTPKEKHYNIEYIREGNKVTYGNGYTDIMVEYNSSGQIIRYKELFYNIEEEYIYDQEGRILEVLGTASKKHYYYTGTFTDSIVSWNYAAPVSTWYKTGKEEIIYTETGYNDVHYTYNNESNSYAYWFTAEYVLDELQRVIEIKESDRSQNNRWTYEYTKNGCIYTVYQPAASAFCRTEYTYNSDGDLIKTIYSEWMNNSYWFPVITTTYEYNFLTAINKVKQEPLGIDIKVVGKNLCVHSDSEVSIELYNLQGKVIKRATADLEVSLARGLYILKAGNLSRKISISH